MKLRDVMCSNLWPVVAYAAMILWFVVIGHMHLGLNFHFTADQFYALSQLDAIVHFAVALSLAATFTPVFGKKLALTQLIIVIIAWELFEMLVLSAIRPNLFSQPGRPGLLDFVYVSDTLDDIALGTAGALIGVYFGEASNTPSV